MPKLKVIDLQQVLKAIQPLISISAIAKESGVSKSTLIAYKNGRKSTDRTSLKVIKGIESIAAKLFGITSQITLP